MNSKQKFSIVNLKASDTDNCRFVANTYLFRKDLHQMIFCIKCTVIPQSSDPVYVGYDTRISATDLWLYCFLWYRAAHVGRQMYSCCQGSRSVYCSASSSYHPQVFFSLREGKIQVWINKPFSFPSLCLHPSLASVIDKLIGRTNVVLI